MIKSQTAWEEVKDSLRIGMKIRGKVLRHAPFGIFVSLPEIPFDGLVQITDFKDAGRMTPNEYPALESTVDAVVLGFKETGNQIWLSMKPSQIDRAGIRDDG
jgi:ribosomal protein S1